MKNKGRKWNAKTVVRLLFLIIHFVDGRLSQTVIFRKRRKLPFDQYGFTDASPTLCVAHLVHSDVVERSFGYRCPTLHV